MNIEVVYALPDNQQCVTVSVETGTTARQAIVHVMEHGLVSLSDTDSQKDVRTLPIGVYGQQVDDNYCLKAGDRVEIYRPLLQDPKERRRQIARQNAS